MSAIIQTAEVATRPRSFYCWWVVLTQALGPIPISAFSFAVFLQALAQEFHASLGAVSLARTVHSTILALPLPFALQFLDRYGARRVILPSTIVAGLVVVSAYFSIWSFLSSILLPDIGPGHLRSGAASILPCGVALV